MTVLEFESFVALSMIFYKTIDVIKAIPGVSIYNEKDYILNAKPNGYRSYHLILEIETEFPDVLGNEKGTYFVEVQLRTIAQDSWGQFWSIR